MSDTGHESSNSSEAPLDRVTEELVTETSPLRLQGTPQKYLWDIADDLFNVPFLDFDDSFLRSEDNIETAAVTDAESPQSPSGAGQAMSNEVIHAQPQFMPQLDHLRFALFGHYIQTTANSIANGSTCSNPFIVQLLPLTVSSGLVLESILAQSCAHRAVRAPMITESPSLSLYSKSLRSLRTAIQTVASQTMDELLALVVSMLVLCFTEVSRPLKFHLLVHSADI